MDEYEHVCFGNMYSYRLQLVAYAYVIKVPWIFRFITQAVPKLACLTLPVECMVRNNVKILISKHISKNAF